MRYELTDYEWTAIKPFLPTKPRGVPRVNDRRVLNGIFWVLRSGAPWRDLPDTFGPYTTCYNRFARWRRAGIWDRIMNSLSLSHDADVQMIDTSIVRVHQHGACIAANSEQLMGRSRGGLTTKIHAVVDSGGLPIRLALTTGEARFDAHLDRTGISLTLERVGDVEARRSIRMHLHYGLFTEILRELAKTVSMMPEEDADHRTALRDAAGGLYRALAAKPARRSSKKTAQKLKPHDEFNVSELSPVRLLHILE